MKRKRKLIEFTALIGNNADDFIRNQKTLCFYYRLAGQKYRRHYINKITNEMLNDVDTKILSKILWHGFKTDLNIYF